MGLMTAIPFTYLLASLNIRMRILQDSLTFRDDAVPGTLQKLRPPSRSVEEKLRSRPR